MIRILDIFFSSLGLILLSPILLIVALLIKIESRGPVIFKQLRVGRFGIEFALLKFRSMKEGSDKNGLLTIGARDGRITLVGFILRKYKIDELPQLINVLKGEMSLVGPRPEVKKYVEAYTTEQRIVLTVRPGITDWASIMYKSENEILGNSINPELDYIQKIVPDKIKYNLIYIKKKGVYEYLKIIFLTILSIVNQKVT